MISLIHNARSYLPPQPPKSTHFLSLSHYKISRDLTNGIGQNKSTEKRDYEKAQEMHTYTLTQRKRERGEKYTHTKKTQIRKHSI